MSVSPFKCSEVMSSFLFALLLAAFCACQVAATCYNPDGSEIKDPAYQACNQFLGAFSPCCGTNHTGVVAPDTCQTNGLCQNNGDSVYWRQGCTDKTWKSPFCLHLCTDPQVSLCGEQHKQKTDMFRTVVLRMIMLLLDNVVTGL